MNNKVDKINKQTETYHAQESLIDVQYEIINGIRYGLSPSPTFDHQILVTQIWNEINITCHTNGIVVVAPIDVYLSEENIVQPDIVFISNENAGIIQNQKIIGAPDLLIEVLSKNTSKKDKSIKKEVYERFGVKEYWIVDPVHFIIDRFERIDGSYKGYKSFGLGDTIHSPNLACISIKLEKLFEQVINRKTDEEINEIRNAYGLV